MQVVELGGTCDIGPRQSAETELHIERIETDAPMLSFYTEQDIDLNFKERPNFETEKAIIEPDVFDLVTSR